MSTPTGTPDDLVPRPAPNTSRAPAASTDVGDLLDDLGRPHPLRLSQRVGLWILVAIAVLSVLPFLQNPTDDTAGDGSPAGPPPAIVALDAVLVVGTVVAIVVAFRTGSRVALRVACGLAIVNALTALPAFFSDQPAVVVIEAAVFVVATGVAVVLALRAPRAEPGTLPAV